VLEVCGANAPRALATAKGEGRGRGRRVKERRVERKWRRKGGQGKRNIKWALPPPTRGIGLLTSAIIYHNVV